MQGTAEAVVSGEEGRGSKAWEDERRGELESLSSSSSTRLGRRGCLGKSKEESTCFVWDGGDQDLRSACPSTLGRVRNETIDLVSVMREGRWFEALYD